MNLDSKKTRTKATCDFAPFWPSTLKLGKIVLNFRFLSLDKKKGNQ